MLNILKLVMCFVLQLTVTQVVVQQMGFSKKSAIFIYLFIPSSKACLNSNPLLLTTAASDWYVFLREVCEAIVSNELQGKICRKGTSMDESHLSDINMALVE